MMPRARQARGNFLCPGVPTEAITKTVRHSFTSSEGLTMSEVTVAETRKIILSVNHRPTMEREIWDWLQQRGVAVIRARSTTKAMELLGRAQYDAVITN